MRLMPWIKFAESDKPSTYLTRFVKKLTIIIQFGVYVYLQTDVCPSLHYSRYNRGEDHKCILQKVVGRLGRCHCIPTGKYIKTIIISFKNII